VFSGAVTITNNAVVTGTVTAPSYGGTLTTAPTTCTGDELIVNPAPTSAANVIGVCFNGALSFPVGSGTIPVPLTLSDAATGTTSVLNLFSPSLTIGDLTGLTFGLSGAADSGGQLVFNNVAGAGSSSNIIGIGVTGEPLMQIGSAGNVKVPGQLAVVSTVTAGAASITNAIIGGGINSLTSVGALQGFDSGGSAVTFTLGSSSVVGTGATVACATSHFCDQFSGVVTLVTGTAPTAAAASIITINFPVTRADAPNCPYSVDNTTTGTMVTTIVENSNTISINFSSSVVLTGSTTINFMYVCGGS
jgi:hypothetical protein